MSSDLLYWIWLSQRLGHGSSVLPDLVARFSSAYEIYRATDEEIMGFDTDGREDLSSLTDKNLDDAHRVAEYCFTHKIGTLVYDSPEYPSMLRNIQSPPAVLYYRGRLPEFEKRPCIAVVGTRKMSEYGRDSAYKIAYELSASGAITVSGMALGVDAMVACGSLSAGKPTVAVLGCGVDRVYPAKHRILMEKIIKKGCVISEYAPGTEPVGSNFPVRNRIISGLCKGTLVIEADEFSGALITAKNAILQGRDIFALPGNVNSPNSRGPNNLIMEGARPVTCANDILRIYRGMYGIIIKITNEGLGSRSDFRPSCAKSCGLGYAVNDVMPAPTNGAQAVSYEEPKPVQEKKEEGTVHAESEKKPDRAEENPALAALDEQTRAVYNALGDGSGKRVEALAATGIPVGRIMASLTMLEISGLVEQKPGGAYAKK